MNVLNIKTKDIALAGVFTAMVAAATMTMSVFIAASGGFFNIGEIMIYITALLMGPLIGGFAGGVGSMIADIALGYTVFAPGTLIIKSVEGIIVGYVSRNRPTSLKESNWKFISILTGIIVGGIIWAVGTTMYVGETSLSLGLPLIGYSEISLSITESFWIVLSIIALIAIIITCISLEAEIGWLVISILLGGITMVVGYFLYSSIIMGPIAAKAEIPFNIMQITIGLIVSIPLYKTIINILPKYKIK